MGVADSVPDAPSDPCPLVLPAECDPFPLSGGSIQQLDWKGEGRHFQDYVARRLGLLSHTLPLRAWLQGKFLPCCEWPHRQATWQAGDQGLSTATPASSGAEHPGLASPPLQMRPQL